VAEKSGSGALHEEQSRALPMLTVPQAMQFLVGRAVPAVDSRQLAQRLAWREMGAEQRRHVLVSTRVMGPFTLRAEFRGYFM
jgi:hypothetical protein